MTGARRRPMPLLPALGALALTLAGCDAPPPAADAPPAVSVAQARTGPAQPALAATGVLVPRDELRLAFKVGGIVRDVRVQAGERVRAGQVLAELDATELDAQLSQARELAEKARRDLARGEALHADQVIPLEQLQNLRTQAEVAAAQLRAAEFNGRQARLVAPRDALVLRRLVEPRDTVPPGQVVLVLGGEASGMAVRAAVSDREVTRLAVGDRADVRLDAWPERSFGATVSEIGGAASERSGLFEIEARLDATDAALRAGMVARLQIHPAGDAGERVHVPAGALVEAAGGRASVFVLQDGRAVAREVGVAFIDAGSVALSEGLRSGETVITAGAPFLRDGDAVRVVP